MTHHTTRPILTDRDRRATIHPRFVPLRCDKCEHPLRGWQEGKDDWNQFTCSNPDTPHPRWIQSPPVAYAILLDEFGDTYIVKRGIPPAVGGWCFPGGYVDYGETAEETIIHETLGEACIRIKGKKAYYLGQWFEPGPGVTVIAFLVHMRREDVDSFFPNTEATQRKALSFWDMDPTTLAFNGNRLALAAARKVVVRHSHEDSYEHP